MIKEKLLDYLKKHKSITVDECREKIGTTECRKIISDLRLFYKITDVWETGYNRYGDKTRWKRYFYQGERQWAKK